MRPFKERGSGKIHDDGKSTIRVKAWAQVLEENRARLQFFQERLEYQADTGASLQYLQERYSRFLEGVLVDGEEEPSDQVQKDSPEDGSDE